jgi:hypothetical protein
LLQPIQPGRDLLPSRDAILIASDRKRTDPFGDHDRRTVAILPLDAERFRPSFAFGRKVHSTAIN